MHQAHGLSAGQLGRESGNPQWVDVQHRTFTAWVNQALSRRGITIPNLPEGLENGVNLCILLEELSGSSLPKKYALKPKSRFEKLQNVGIAFDFIKAAKIPIVAIGPEDVVDMRLKLLLGLIWILILHYQIQGLGYADDSKGNKKQNASGAKKELLQWVKEKVEPKGINVSNFTSSFQDGLVLSALFDSLKPGLIDVDALDKNNKSPEYSLSLTSNAVEKFKNVMGVPAIMTPEDLALVVPDELSVMTYVSLIKSHAEEDKHGCFILGKGIEAPVFGERNDFHISIYKKDDKSPFILPAESIDELEVTVIGPTGETQFLKPKNNKDGTYNASYLANNAGDYEVAIKLFGKFLKGHGKVKVLNNATSSTLDPSKCVAKGDGLHKGSTSKPSHFQILGHDFKGNFVPQGGNLFAVNITPVDKKKGDDEDLLPFAQTTDEGDGSYSVIYLAPLAGEYDINVTFDAKPIQGSPFRAKIREGPEAAKCALKFPDRPIVAGKPEQFVIEARGSDGELLKEGGDVFRVTMDSGGADKAEHSQKDNQDGTYTQNFVCPVAGEYTVEVSIGDEQIAGSPFRFVAKKGLLDPAKTSAEGEGLHHANTHRPSTFSFSTKDSEGNLLPVENSDEYSVDILDPKKEKLSTTKVRDNGDGTYEVSYIPFEEGPHQISIRVDGKEIPQSPFTVPATQLVSAAHSYADGEGVTKWITKKPTTFTIHALDKSGQPIKEGGDEFSVDISGPAEVPAKVRDNRDGTYTVRFVPPVSGEYQVQVKLYGKEPIRGAPFKVFSERGNFAAFTFTSKQGDGSPLTATVNNFDIAVSGPSGQPVIFNPEDIEDGVYGVNFLPNQGPGAYKIAVLLDGDHITNSPFTVNVGGDSGGVSPPIRFPFVPKDRKTSAPIKGANLSDFEVHVRGPDDSELKSELTTSGDGNYGVIFQPTMKGHHKISVNYKGEPIEGSVFVVDIGGQQPPQQQQQQQPQQGQQGQQQQPQQARKSKFPFTPKDKSGNAIKANGVEGFTVEVLDPSNTPLESELVDGKDGTYGVIFAPGAPGHYKISVKYEGEHIQGSVFNINIGGTPTQPGPESNQPRKQLARFKVPGKKKDGSTIPVKSPSEFHIEIEAPSGDKYPATEVNDNGDGTYGITFEQGGPGTYKVSVLHSGEHILNSPFHLNIGGAPAPASSAPAQAPAKEKEPTTNSFGRPAFDPIAGKSFAKFAFEPVDKDGNSLADKLDQLDVSLVAPDGKELGCKVQGPDVGVIFQPLVPGDYQINIYFNKQHIKGSPFVTEIGGQQDMFGSSVAKFRFSALKTRESGKEIPNGISKNDLKISIVGPDESKSIEGTISVAMDKRENQFDANWRPYAAGVYTLNIWYGEEHVDGSPFKINIGGGGGGEGKGVLPQVHGQRT